MSERILFALNDLPNDLLAECEAALAAGGLPEKKHSRLSRFLEPLGYVAMLALVLGVIIVAPDLLRKKPVVSPSDTTETAETEETEETDETAPVTDEEPSSVDRDLASYMRYLPNYFHKTLEIRDGAVFREDISDLLAAFCCFERERLDFVSYEEAEGVGVVTVKGDDLQKVGELLLGETFDLADYRGYWGDPSSDAISRYDEAADCFTVEIGRGYWGGESYYPVFGAEPEYRYDGNTVTVTVPISYQNDFYEGQRITFSYRFEKVESGGAIFYRLLSVTAVPPTTLPPLTATWNGKTVTVKYDVIADIAYPDDMGYIYFCNGYAIFYDYGDDPDNWAISEEGDVWGCMDTSGNRVFSLVCDGITNFDEYGVAVAAFHTSDAGETEYYFINTKGEKVGTATKEDFNTWRSQYEIDVLSPESLGLTVNPAYEESYGEEPPYYLGDRGVWEYGSVWNGLVFMNFDDEGIVLMDTEGNTVLTTDYSFSPMYLDGLLLNEGRLVTPWNGYLAILTVTVTDGVVDEKGPLSEEALREIEDFLNKEENNGFVGDHHLYMAPGQVKLDEVFYNGADIDVPVEKWEENEVQAVLNATGWEEVFNRIIKIRWEDADRFLSERSGLGLEDFGNVIPDFRYVEAYDAYYTMHGDTNYDPVTVLDGNVTEDGRYVVRYLPGNRYDETVFTVTMTKTENGYRFLSNVRDDAYGENDGEATAPDFDEDRVAVYPDGPSIGLDELIGGLKATACPAEDLPAVGAELTREELEELMLFFCGNKLTTAELEAILTEYLGVRLTPRMLQEIKSVAPYLAEYDAYYAFHTDINLADLVILQAG